MDRGVTISRRERATPICQALSTERFAMDDVWTWALFSVPTLLFFAAPRWSLAVLYGGEKVALLDVLTVMAALFVVVLSGVLLLDPRFEGPVIVLPWFAFLTYPLFGLFAGAYSMENPRWRIPAALCLLYPLSLWPVILVFGAFSSA